MYSFQAKIGRKKMRKGKNKNYRSVPFRSRRAIENYISKAKKFKNTIMASFQAKISWKRPRKRENKNSCAAPFLPDAKQKIPKKQQKNLKC